MAKTLRTLSDPDFSTKNNTLTWEEVDQNFIDIWNDPLEGIATADIDTALTNLGLKDGSRDLRFNSLIFGTDPRAPKLDNARSGSPGGLTVQPSGGDHPGSVEIFPQGTSQRSHYLAGNATDPENFGFVKFEARISGSDNEGLIRAAQKGTGVAPTQFVWENFPDGIRFENAVAIGVDTVPNHPLHVQGASPQIDMVRSANTDQGLRIGGAGAVASYDSYNEGGSVHTSHIFRSTNDTETVDIFKMDYENSLTTSYVPMQVETSESHFFVGVGDSNANIRLTQSADDEVGIMAFSKTAGNRLDLRRYDGYVSINVSADETKPTTDAIRFMNDDRKVIPSGAIETDNFSSGWAGTGWQETYSADFEMQNLRVRGALRVYEFIAKQLASIGGTEILSIANAKIEDVDTVNNIITVDNVSGTARTPFKVNDLWIVQVVDINNDLESGGTGSVVYRVYGTVTNTAATDGTLNGDQIEVSVDGSSPDGLSALENQDLIVAYGNTTDTNRQAIMYRNVDRSEDNLIMRLQTGVDSFSALQAEANTRVAFGDLNGYADFSSETFGFFAGDNSSDKMTADATNGVRFLDSSNNTIAQINGNKLTVGDNFEYDAPSDVLDVAGWTIDTEAISKVNGDWGVLVASQSTAFSGTGGNYPSVIARKLEVSDTDVIATMGHVYYDSSFQDEFGFAIAPDINEMPYFQMTSNMTSGDITAKIAGAFFDVDAMWGFPSGYGGDTSDKSNASVLLDFAEGKVRYDTMGTLLINAQNFAPFGQDNGNAEFPANDEWSTIAEESLEQTTTNFLEVANGTFIKRFGEDGLLLIGEVKFDLVSKTGVTHSSQVTIYVREIGGSTVITESQNIPSSSYSTMEFEVDISSISDGSLFIVEVHVDAEVTISSGAGDGSTYSTESFIQEGFVLRTITI